MIIVDCPGCVAGDHERHVEHWGVRPEGVIDGEFCYCEGDCAERAEDAFDRFFENIADYISEDALSPEAQLLMAGLRSSEPTIRSKAVREFNRLLAEDPLPTPPTSDER